MNTPPSSPKRPVIILREWIPVAAFLLALMGSAVAVFLYVLDLRLAEQTARLELQIVENTALIRENIPLIRAMEKVNKAQYEALQDRLENIERTLASIRTDLQLLKELPVTTDQLARTLNEHLENHP